MHFLVCQAGQRLAGESIRTALAIVAQVISGDEGA